MQTGRSCLLWAVEEKMLRSLFDFVNNYLPCNGHALEDNMLESSNHRQGKINFRQQESTETHHSVARALHTVATIFDPHRISVVRSKIIKQSMRLFVHKITIDALSHLSFNDWPSEDYCGELCYL